jgi:hypothetical protein
MNAGVGIEALYLPFDPRYPEQSRRSAFYPSFLQPLIIKPITTIIIEVGKGT